MRPLRLQLLKEMSQSNQWSQNSSWDQIATLVMRMKGKIIIGTQFWNNEKIETCNQKYVSSAAIKCSKIHIFLKHHITKFSCLRCRILYLNTSIWVETLGTLWFCVFRMCIGCTIKLLVSSIHKEKRRIKFFVRLIFYAKTERKLWAFKSGVVG